MKFLDNSSSAHFASQPAEHFNDILRTRTSSEDVEYSLQAGHAFDQIKYCLALLTGTLLLDLLKSDRTVVDVSLTEKAAQALTEARDSVCSCKPSTENSRHHHHHLKRALDLVEESSTWAQQQKNIADADQSDAFSDAIHASWNELKKLDAWMKGFQMVDFSQGCCAYHDQFVQSLSRA